jgi:Flp pilus assembly protein TadD
LRGVLFAATLLLAAPAAADQPLPDQASYQADRALRTAWLAWSRGQVEAAEGSARAAAHHAPKDPDAWRLLCGLLVDSRRWSDADGPCATLLALAPRDAPALLLSSRVALELGREEAARSTALLASELTPQDPAGPLAEALVAARLSGDYAAADSALREARRRAPSRSLAALPTWPGWEALADDEAFIEVLEALLRDDP